MGGKITIAIAQGLKVIAQQLKVQSFLLGDLQPIAVKTFWHALEPPNDVQGQVDRIGFNMRQGMNQSRSTLNGAHRAWFELAGVHQRRVQGAARNTRVVVHPLLGINRERVPRCVANLRGFVVW